MSTEAIKVAQAGLAAAQDVRDVAEKALDAAKKAVARAADNLHAARLECDKAMPQAVIRKKESRWSDKVSETLVVIIRRTPKTLFVRRPGDANETGDQCRLKCGRWWVYPKPESWDPSRELILKD